MKSLKEQLRSGKLHPMLQPGVARVLPAVATALLVAASSIVQTQPPSLQTTIETLRASTKTPAVAAVAFTSATVGEVAVTGVRKQGDPTTVSASDLWHIGSITKSFTSTLVGKLVERGKLSWSMTLGELAGDARARQFAGVTLTQILSHRAGLPANLPPTVNLSDSLPVQRQAFLDLALAADPLSAPGSAFLYSNGGYIIVGAILEQRTGKSWEELLRDEVLAPLGLSTAGFGAPGTRNEITQPRGHRLIDDALVPIEPPADNPAFSGPAGTLHMSVSDLARWGQEHLRGERGQGSLLRTATYRFLHAAQSQTPENETGAISNYALGWANQRRAGVRIIMHTGSNTLWCAVVSFDPVGDRGIAIVANGPNSQLAAIQTAAGEWIVAKRE
jgi:CubicO group peptidase (beta-lactamase class C family)